MYSNLIRMKKILFTFIFVMTSAVLFAQKNNPFSYPYYISGETEIDANNDGFINIKNVNCKGFKYTRHRRSGTQERPSFVFEEIKTDPPISITGKRLQYWRQDKSGEWITDAEGGNGTFDDKLEKDITIVMTLDCSASLGSDFQRVKNSALSFLEKIYEASSDGHINLGIIGFSSIAEAERQTFEIKPLTTKTYNDATNFIRSLSTDSNTALYYAVNKATDMLNNYVSSHFASNAEYGGTYMLVFTDGIDNASQFRSEKIFKSEDAYDYAKLKLQNTYIKGSHIKSYLIGAVGVDLKTDYQRKEFKRILEGLCPADSSEFTYLGNMSDLEDTFAKIAEGLTKQWQNLVCTTSPAHEGGVCWTLGEVYIPPVVKPKYSNIFLGVNVGAGIALINDAVGISIPAGVDFAYPITKNFGLGAYGGFTYSICDYDYVSTALGVLATIGNYHDGNKTFVGGLGFRLDFDTGSVKPNIRGGVLFRSGIYIMGDISFGAESYSSYYYDGYSSHFSDYSTFGFQAMVQIGYNFGKHIRIKRR